MTYPRKANDCCSGMHQLHPVLFWLRQTALNDWVYAAAVRYIAGHIQMQLHPMDVFGTAIPPLQWLQETATLQVAHIYTLCGLNDVCCMPLPAPLHCTSPTQDQSRCCNGSVLSHHATRAVMSMCS